MEKNEFNPLNLLNEDREHNRLPIGKNNNEYYFGTVLEDELGNFYDAVITSKKKLYYVNKKQQINQIKDNFNLSYKNVMSPALLKSVNCWTQNKYEYSIKKWMSNENLETIEFENLYNEIKEKIEYYMDFWWDNRLYDLITCSIIATYFYPLFEAFPRIYFSAQRRSGKSKLSKDIFGNLAFNAISANDMSFATMKDLPEEIGGTIILDNFDYEKDADIPDFRRKINLIEAGYTRSGVSLYKDTKRGNRTLSVESYCPMIINNTKCLPEVTETRCIKIPLMIGRDDIKINRNITKLEIDNFREITNKLHVFTLENWEKIEYNYQNINSTKLKSRDLQIASPILSIAKLRDEKTFEDLEKYIYELKQRRDTKETDYEWGALILENILKIIKEEFKNEEFIKIRLTTIRDNLRPIIAPTFIGNYGWFSRNISDFLKTIPIIEIKKIQGFTEARFTKSKFFEYLESENIIDYEKVEKVEKVEIVEIVEIVDMVEKVENNTKERIEKAWNKENLFDEIDIGDI